MRTKALLLTAALGVAGIASSMAQTVYSVNIVGYINKTLPGGISLLANQLNHTPNNGVATVIGTGFAGTIRINKFNPTTGNFEEAVYDSDNAAWNDPHNLQLNPGTGFYLDNQLGVPLPLTFVGEVQLVSSITIHPGQDLYSSVLPQAGDFNAIQFPVPDGTVRMNKYNATTKKFEENVFDADNGAWTQGIPTVAIGDAFWIDNQQGHASTWARSFPVGP